MAALTPNDIVRGHRLAQQAAFQTESRHVKRPPPPAPLPPMVYGYVRVSTGKQAKEGESLEAQTKKIAEYCKKNRLPAPHISVDSGVSGKTMANRSNLTDIRDQSREGDFIVTYSLSRVGRNTEEMLAFARVLMEKKVHFIVLDHNKKEVDMSDPSQVGLYSMLATFDTMERARTGIRTSMVMQSMAQENKLRCSAPFGYRLVAKKLVEDPEEIRTVDAIGELLLANPKLRDVQVAKAIQARVDAGELSMRKFRSKAEGSQRFSNGAKVHQSTIAKIIRKHRFRELDALAPQDQPPTNECLCPPRPEPGTLAPVLRPDADSPELHGLQPDHDRRP